MQFICPIKINLNLHVISKRKDNYHNLQSLVVFVDGGDRLSFYPVPSSFLGGRAYPQSQGTECLQVNGPFASMVPMDETNSILRAHRAFEEAIRRPVAGRWYLEKTVPVGAGLGSASANAAGALRLLQAVNPLHEEKIVSIGKAIGSDVTACLLSRSAIMEGVGDRLTLAPDVIAPPLVIVFPSIMLSTKMMFNKLFSCQSRFSKKESMQNMKNIWATQNVFEAVACQEVPVIGEVLQALRETTGCRLARLSGSGSACFGVYDTQDQGHVASAALKARYPAMWVWSGAAV
jgi:4-diphosphocytidyl-2-C-methyl-D-erythritol kinase